jgi:hypothetical protein
MTGLRDDHLTTQGAVAPSRINIDGQWGFVPGDHPLDEITAIATATIEVPGLWEAAGYPHLDGPAWYRRTFYIDDPAGCWTLHFGAVMDEADVFLNDEPIGSHVGAFTPFDLDVTGRVRAGENELLVRVIDYPSGDPRHLQSAHGKQGWMNDYFPSPPSLYMNFGGIWQSVELERHGPAYVNDIFVNSDPDDLVVDVNVRALDDINTQVTIDVLGHHLTRSVEEGTDGVVRFSIGAVDDDRWSPESPALHWAHVVAEVGGVVSHTRQARFGLRAIRLTETGLQLNGRRTPIRSALVQGFRADTLYAEGSDRSIEAEILAAREAGFNMLRLHIKAFDPRYLDLCDELGMLVHCDIPVAEPIAHDELDSDGVVAGRCAQATAEQVRRDRNHPSIVLWSAMNELGVDDLASRRTAGYEGFVRRLYGAIAVLDPTRPIIENDWTEPDPEFVFCSPILTAHWYGRLTAAYLRDLTAKTRRWADVGRPLFVSEFGDWGLPDLGPGVGSETFWDYREPLREVIRASYWCGTPDEFVTGTQRYQGIADRLQIEIFRSTPGVMGWCLTELTDVPQEFNGVLDLLRKPKDAAVVEVSRASQPVLPIVLRTSWSAEAGAVLHEDVLIVNDGPAVDDVELHTKLGASETTTIVGPLPEGSVTRVDAVQLDVPETIGSMEIELSVRHGETLIGENRYPIQIVDLTGVDLRVATLGDSIVESVITRAGATVADLDSCDVFVVGEGMLDISSAALVSEHLRTGGAVLVLAQDAEAAQWLPIDAQIEDLATEWGSTPFVFTTGSNGLASLPVNTVLTTEILEVAPNAVLTSITGLTDAFVGVVKPPPGPIVGAVVGQAQVSSGVLTFCQLSLIEAATRLDPLARALVGDLLRLAVTRSGIES